MESDRLSGWTELNGDIFFMLISPFFEWCKFLFFNLSVVLNFIMASFLTSSHCSVFSQLRWDICMWMHVCIPKYMWRREQERQLISDFVYKESLLGFLSHTFSFLFASSDLELGKLSFSLCFTSTKFYSFLPFLASWCE